MSRIPIALSLGGCMIWLTSTSAIGPPGQEKVIVQEAPAKAVKLDDKAKTEKEKAPAGADKKAIKAKGVKAAPPIQIRAIPLLPAQNAKQGMVAPARRVVAPAVFLPPQANGDFLLQQLLPQFQRIHKAELHFMRMVCQPTKQQFEKIAAEGEPALKEAVQKYGRWNPNGGNVVMVQAIRAGQESEADSDQDLLVANVVAKSVHKVLSAELAERYDKELNERWEANKHAVATGFVVKMDKLLHLTAEQREQLTKLLDAKWKYSVTRVRLLTLGDQYFPTMPDTEIDQILTEPQRRVWAGIQHKGTVNFGISLQNQMQPDIEEVWDAPGQKPAPKGASPTNKTKATDKKERP
jgi:hypothetical protein